MSRPGLRVLYLGWLPPEESSLAIVGRQLVAGLAARGHRVRAIGMARPAPLRPAETNWGVPPSVRVTHLFIPHLAPMTLAPEGPRRELGMQLRAIVDVEVADHRPDVLLVNGTNLAEFLPTLVAAQALPSVLTVHGGTTFGILDGTIPEARGRAIVDGLRRATQLVAVAPHLAAALRSLGLEGIRVIGNPVDMQRFAPRPKDRGLMERWSVAPDDVVVAHVSSLVDSKRPLDIVLSAEQTLDVDPRLLYLVLGDGPLRATMERICAELGVAARFRFVGRVDHAGRPRLPRPGRHRDRAVRAGEPVPGLIRRRRPQAACSWPATSRRRGT